jgi:hypothetical protein
VFSEAGVSPTISTGLDGGVGRQPARANRTMGSEHLIEHHLSRISVR